MTTTTGAFPDFIGYTIHAINESFEPGSHASFTHSACLGDAASRATALFALAGSPGVPCGFPEAVVSAITGARMSAALMCIM
jgi:hypothetical protein